MSSSVNIKIIRSKRKTISFQVTNDARLIIKAPLGISRLYIEKLANQKTEWIQQRMGKVQKRLLFREKRYTDGEEFFYLGEKYCFKIGNYTAITLRENFLLFPQVLLFRANKELVIWYKRQAQNILTRRTMLYANQMKVIYKSITFSDTKSQWGSCTADNKLQFNWRLVLAPYAVIDYVIVHELVHTIEKNHTWIFWSKVRFVLPAYNQRRKWLTVHGDELII